MLKEGRKLRMNNSFLGFDNLNIFNMGLKSEDMEK